MANRQDRALKRRSVLGGAASLLAASLAAPRPAGAAEMVTLGLTPVVVESDLVLLAAMEKELSARIGAPVGLVKRRTYQEIMALLLAGQVTAAWICGFPFIRHWDQLSILAAPLYQGAPLYRSYFIAPADAPGAVWQDFRGRMHAFSDPDSNSGWLVTTHMLAMAGTTPEAFFSRTFFTYGHRNVVRAVAAGLADCGSVDGYVWDVLAEREPELTARTRVVRRSELLGFPPIACLTARLAHPSVQALGAALAGLPQDAAGREVLGMLKLDGFARVDASVYDSIAAKWRDLHG
jgi:phosphonate transport system substrate-binding protein